MSRKNYFDRIRGPSDYVEESCKTCKFNFSDQGICAAHDSLFGYGEKITDCNATCDQWMISLAGISCPVPTKIDKNVCVKLSPHGLALFSMG